MRLTLQTFMTLDGVIQAPGGPTEDVEGDFPYGGWSFAFADEESGATIVAWFEHADAFLLGRKTYDIFAGHWPLATDPATPVAAKLNALPKYVASRGTPALSWNNSSLLGDDVVAAVTELKAKPGGELQVHGSSKLAQTLIEHDLVDEYRFFTFPVHLGAGKRLFEGGVRPATLKLTSSQVVGKGVVVSTYVPDGDVRLGSFLFDDEAPTA